MSGDSSGGVGGTSSVLSRGSAQGYSVLYILLTSGIEDCVVVVGREGGVVEHIRHREHSAHCPGGEVLVEAGRSVEHIVRIEDLTGIPTA